MSSIPFKSLISLATGQTWTAAGKDEMQLWGNHITPGLPGRTYSLLLTVVKIIAIKVTRALSPCCYLRPKRRTEIVFYAFADFDRWEVPLNTKSMVLAPYEPLQLPRLQSRRPSTGCPL